MKHFTAICFLMLTTTTVGAQHGFPMEIEQSLSRLERVFNTADTRELSWVLPAAIRMRIEDSAYSTITDKYVMEMLHRYLAAKDSLSFKFTGALISELDGRHTSGILPELRINGRGNIRETVYIATGTLFFVSEGHHNKVEVTAYLLDKPERQLAGIDISMKLRGTVFFTSPYN